MRARPIKTVVVSVVLAATGCMVALANSPSWVAVPSMTEARAWPAAATVEGKIHVFGGNLYALNQVYYARYLDSIEYFDPEVGTWSIVGRLPHPLRSMTASTVNGKVYVIGGHRSGTTYASVWEYDPSSGGFLPRSPMPIPRFDHAAAVVEGRIHVFGGSPGPGQAALQVVHVYDPQSDSWTTAPPMPVGRWALGAAVVDKRIYVLGGQNGSVLSNRVDVFDTETATWSLAQPLPRPVSGVAATALHGLVYAIGGGYGSPDYYYAGSLVYDPSTGVWSDGPPMVSPRVVPAVVTVQDTIYAIGGMVDPIPYGWPDTTNSVEALQVQVPDTTPPVISDLVPSQAELWPPDHRMTSVGLSFVVVDDVDPTPACAISSVTSDEPIDGLGDGDTSPDWAFDGVSLSLRRERSGKGTGRLYTVTLRCEDASGNASEAATTVVVPHSRGKQGR